MKGNRRLWKMSATAISDFKDCATRFRLGYVEGLRKIEDTDVQRMGTNWHTCLEVAKTKPDTPCPVCFGRSLDTLADDDCPLCSGTGLVPDIDPLDRAMLVLNNAYETVPVWANKTDWAVERVILAYSLSGYLWYYSSDAEEIETLACELCFELPLRNPKTRRSLPNVKKVGKIDRLIRWKPTLQVLVNEYKSTSKSIDSDSTYWNRLNLDTQIGLYVLAATEMWERGDFAVLGLDSDHPESIPQGVLYDVWHRPQIRPKKLSQADTKTFLESGEYMGTEFEVDYFHSDVWDDTRIGVNGEDTEITWGVEKKPTKKNPNPERPFAIKETPEMFGARLLADIAENPEKHFARRPLARTAADLDKIEHELYNIYKSIRSMDKSGFWFTNEKQCEATFKCSYCPICYNNLDVFDGVTPVDGFRRIFDQETSHADAPTTETETGTEIETQAPGGKDEEDPDAEE